MMVKTSMAHDNQKYLGLNDSKLLHLSDGPPVVGLLLALLGPPGQSALVGHDRGSQRGPVVASPSDQHQARARDLGAGAETELRRARGHL